MKIAGLYRLESPSGPVAWVMLDSPTPDAARALRAKLPDELVLRKPSLAELLAVRQQFSGVDVRSEPSP